MPCARRLRCLVPSIIYKVFTRESANPAAAAALRALDFKSFMRAETCRKWDVLVLGHTCDVLGHTCDVLGTTCDVPGVHLYRSCRCPLAMITQHDQTSNELKVQASSRSLAPPLAGGPPRGSTRESL
ncbi:unnamed protein product [Lampetra fluviatilis]